MSQDMKKIVHAFWESKGSCLIALASDWLIDSILPPITLSSSGLRFGSLEQLSPKESGNYFGYYRDKSHWFFVLQSQLYPQQVDGNTRVYLAADFNNWTEAIGKSEWELVPQKKGKHRLFHRLKIPVQQISEEKPLEFKFVTDSGDWLDVLVNAPNAVTNSDGFVNLQLNPQQTGKHIFRLSMPTNYVPVGNEMLAWRDANYEENHELSNIQFLLIFKYY